MSTRNPPTTDTLGADLMNTNLLEELTANPHMLAAVLTPPIAFNPIFVDIAGSLTAGLLLSFMIDEPGSEAWSVLDAEKILRCTRMTPAELRGARQRLRDAGLTEERRVGFPARTEFKVDFERLKVAILHNVRRPAPASANATQGAALASLDTPIH